MGTQRPAVWLPAGGVGGDRPRRHPQAEPNHGPTHCLTNQTPQKSGSVGWGRVSHAATVSRSTRSPRPRQAATPPAGPCKGAAHRRLAATATEGGSSAGRY